MYEQLKIETWQWIVTATVIIILIVIGITVFGTPRVENYSTEEFCMKYRGVSAHKVPVGCLEYYKIKVTDVL